MALLASVDFEISADPTLLDIDAIHCFLTRSHWAQGRTRDVVERCIRNSLCFGAYASGRQIAFARAITDRAVFAYLADVFVVPEYRGRGIAQKLIHAILAHPELQGLRVIMLRSRDAQGLYRKFGFDAVPRPEELMGLYGPERS